MSICDAKPLQRNNLNQSPATVYNRKSFIDCNIKHMTSIVSNCTIKSAYRPPADLERQMDPPNPENRPDGTRACSVTNGAPPAPATPRQGQHLRALYIPLFYCFQHSFQYTHFHAYFSYLFYINM